MVDEIRRDPVTGDTVVVRRGGGGSNTLLIVLLLVAALAALAYFTGFINVNGGSAPKVSVTGGSAPEVTTGKLVVGTEKKVVDVPKVGVEKAPAADANN